MHHVTSVIVLSAALGLLAGNTAAAQESTESDDQSGPPILRGLPAEERRAIWESLSEAEKQQVRARQRAARQKQREEWQSLSEEERNARIAKMREREANMTPEQRKAIEERRERNLQRMRNSPSAIRPESSTDANADPGPKTDP